MLRLMLADDEQFERDYLEKVVKESYPTLLKLSAKRRTALNLWKSWKRVIRRLCFWM